MFQKTKFILFTLFVGSMMFVSCNNGDDDVGPCGANWIFATQIADEANALATAASAYGQDPTTANCEAYRQAYQDYLDAARALENCARQVGQLTEYNQALADAQAGLDALQC